MSIWKYAPAAVVVAGLAMLVGPDLVSRYKTDERKQERDALAVEIEGKLKAVEAESAARAASAPVRKPGISVASLRKSRSEVDEVDWYGTAIMAKNDVFTAYIGDKGAEPWLRVHLSRSSGTQILMLTGVTIVASGVRASASGQLETAATDEGRMLERIDIKADREMVAALMAAADKQVGSIKIVGHNGADERRLTGDELADLRRVIDAYRELGGQ